MPELLSAASLADDLTPVIKRLNAGKCVALPTETVYGLAGDATQGQAVARIFEMKQRPRFNPLICHVSDREMAAEYGHIDSVTATLIDRFWPGPLTVLVPKNPRCAVHELVTADLDTIALRCPQGIAREIISTFERPLAAPSANRSGRVSPTSAVHVLTEFPETDLMIVDGGPCDVGIESTIVKIERDRLVVLRPGTVTVELLQASSELPVIAQSEGKVQAPGMMQSHYAPNASVLINQNECANGAALLAFGQVDGKRRIGASIVRNLSDAGDLREAASNLYAHLKTLDESGSRLICVEPIPMEGLGVAINDRLKRAAAPREME